MNAITTIIVGASSRGALARYTCCISHSEFCKVYSVNKGKAVKLKASTGPDTPSSATSTGSGKQFTPSPDPEFLDLSMSDHSQESWKSASSELSYTDGGKSTQYFTSRESQQITPRERPFGRIPSPHHHANSNEFPQPGSAHTYESMVLGGNYSSTNFSGSGDSDTGPAGLPRQPAANISAMLQPINNLHLQVRTKESTPSYSLSGSSESSEIRSFLSDVSLEAMDQNQFSNLSRSSNSSQAADVEDELRKLKLEMKQITIIYNTACQEENENNLEEAKNSQEAAMAMVEREKMKCKAAMEIAQKAQRIAELESEKRRHAEMKFRLQTEEKQKAIDALAHTEVQYRRYTMEEIQIATNYFSASEKIGEGGYGPVFKGSLDHTPVAIKVLRPDISQGEKQFQREVEVLSRMRHPNMVILLGACPEYGSLVYEHMDNGSLEDGLNCKSGRPPLSWQARFRIAVEISTALNFLHRTRPEPLVHRDLKPANILLDRNNVSKISDVGLSRLVPPSVADSITQCCMTAAAGTFCYIDPEYQQTGMLGTKSDIYSLGIVLLQIITARPAMGLTHHVETAIENDQFVSILDPTVRDWPVEGALSFAKLALQCCELRRKDRPDLDSVILPQRTDVLVQYSPRTSSWENMLLK